MTSPHYPILLIIVSTLSSSWAPRGVLAASSVADSYPVMIEDGESNFLILNDDEVANSQFLKLFPGASKEEVEELVDSSPQMQDMILDRIKAAVAKRKKSKAPAKRPVGLEKKPEADKKIEVEQPSEQIIHIVHHSHGDTSIHVDEVEDEDDDGVDGLDDVKVAKMRAKLRTKAAKVFKIGAKMKEKLMKFVRKSAKKKAKKTQNGRFPRPHFRYKVTTVNDE